MRTVKILHLITELSTGGAQTALHRLLAAMDRQRYAVSVACLYNGDGAPAQRIRDLGVPVTDLNMSSKLRVDAVWRLRQLLRETQPTILHAWLFHANLLARLLGRLANVPIIVTSRRNGHIGGFWREMATRMTTSLDDHVVAVCESARQMEVQHSRVPPDKVITIYNGVDISEFSCVPVECREHIRSQFEIPLDAPLIGAIGRLHPQKGCADLITALAEVRDQAPDICSLIVGEGELRDKLQALVNVTDLNEAIVFAGNRTDIPEILAALDLFVLPSLSEGLPNVILEAMAAGLPVVATNVGGTPELVVHGETGLLVPPDNPPELAQAILTLLSDPERAHNMGRAGRARVEQHFTLQKMARQTETLYAELLQSKLGLHYREGNGWVTP